jgi:hypothetical protein
MAAACAWAILGLPTAAVAFDRVDAPSAGTYQALVWVQSVSGAGCLDKASYAFTGSVSFAGLGGSKHYLRALEAGSNLALVSIQTLTVTTGKGTTKPYGDFTWSVSGMGGSASANGSFTSTITEIGTHAFVWQLKESYANCSSEVINLSLARIGANQ